MTDAAHEGDGRATLLSMGWIKDAKANALAAEARKAAGQGQTVFTAMLNTPMTKPDLSGEIADWSLMIAAVEAEGWALQHWAIGVDTKGRAQAYPLFRRL